jgi:peptidoglycan/LPS O-acetylase OafA/YrhL
MKHVREYRTDIDGLRGIAVLAVVLFHAGFGLHGGYVGVDVFFVLSGFLITGLIARDLETGSFSLAGFWERRVRRILPAATVMVVVTLAAGLLLLMPEPTARLGRAAAASSVMLANVHYFATSSYFEDPSELLPLLHIWSLAVEEQFYVLFPLLLVFAWRRGRSVALGAVAINGFDESFVGWGQEDDHFCDRLQRLGRAMWQLLGRAICFRINHPTSPSSKRNRELRRETRPVPCATGTDRYPAAAESLTTAVGHREVTR